MLIYMIVGIAVLSLILCIDMFRGFRINFGTVSFDDTLKIAGVVTLWPVALIYYIHKLIK